MVYKGMVMKTTKDYIIVLTEDVNYVKLKSKGNIDIGKKIMFIEEDILKERNRSLKPLIAVAAAIILILTTVIGQFHFDYLGNFRAYAIVSLDINPSLEFQIDEKEIVRKVNSLNRDGKELLNNNMVGMRIEDAVALSIKTALNEQYLGGEDNVVVISSVIMDDGVYEPAIIEDKIFQRIEEDEKLKNIDVIYLDSNKENLKKARENNLSVGKYEVYRMVSDENPNIKIEDIKEKKVSDIVKENNDLAKAKKEKDEKHVKDNIKNKDNSENYKGNIKGTKKQYNHSEDVNYEKEDNNKKAERGNKKNENIEGNANAKSKNNIKKNEKNENDSSKKDIKEDKSKEGKEVKEKKKNNRKNEEKKSSKDSKKARNRKTNKKNKDK